MKNLILFTFFLILNVTAKGQKYNHYITLNTTPYVNYFNKEKESFPNTKFYVHPSLSYKIEKGKVGLELFFNANLKVYNNFNYADVPNPDSTYLNILNYKFGLAVHYNILNINWLTIDSYLGIVQDKIDLDGILKWTNYQDHTWYEAKLFNVRELNYGILTGLITKLFIYKNIYMNVNMKYSLFPTSKWNNMNLFGELGLGYKL